MALAQTQALAQQAAHRRQLLQAIPVPAQRDKVRLDKVPPKAPRDKAQLRVQRGKVQLGKAAVVQ